MGKIHVVNGVAPKAQFTKNQVAELEKKIYQMALNSVAHKQFTVNGAAEFYARELAYFWPRLLMTQYADLTYRNYVPIVNAPMWKNSIVFNILDIVGQADLKTSRANDADAADVYLSEMEVPVSQVNAFFEFDFVERAAAEALQTPDGSMPGSQIIRGKLMAVFRMLDQRLQNLFFNGDEETGELGLLNNDDIPSTTITTNWGSATTDQKLGNILDTFNQVRSQSKGKFVPNTMIMSLDKYTSIYALPRSQYSNKTILGWAEENLPGIDRIIPDPFLNGKGDDGSGIIIALDRNEDHANMVISAENVAQPVQYQGVQEFQYFTSRATTLNLLQSKSIFKTDGI